MMIAVRSGFVPNRSTLELLESKLIVRNVSADVGSRVPELEETLRRVKAYRQADADFESAISKFAEAEAESAAQDPVEGQTTRAKGPAQRLVRELIRR